MSPKLATRGCRTSFSEWYLKFTRTKNGSFYSHKFYTSDSSKNVLDFNSKSSRLVEQSFRRPVSTQDPLMHSLNLTFNLICIKLRLKPLTAGSESPKHTSENWSKMKDRCRFYTHELISTERSHLKRLDSVYKRRLQIYLKKIHS